MKAILLIISTLALVSIAMSHIEFERQSLKSLEEESTMEEFKVFHQLHNKEYDFNSEEGVLRYGIFKSSVKMIKETNAQNLSYQLEVNKFADLTVKEFQEKYLMNAETKRSESIQGLRKLKEEGLFNKFLDVNIEKVELKGSAEAKQEKAWAPIDWAKYFSPIRDQGNCGACWTFSATATVEAMRNMKSGKIMGHLSTQQLVDCDNSNWACSGGDLGQAFTYVKTYGLVEDAVYPYKEIKQANCTVSSTAPRTKIAAFTFCSNYWEGIYNCSEEKVYANLQKGPTAVGIDAKVTQFYKGGIFTGACLEDNHAVVLVGYGVENGVEFYKIRNSMGAEYGENGYIRIAKNKINNQSCFINVASYSVTLA